jgi:predicted phage terminase large subunit-like protein
VTTAYKPSRDRFKILPEQTLNRARQQLFSIVAQGLRTGEIKLEEFFKQAWPIIEPATPLQDVWYIGFLAEHLTAVIEGQITRLAISIHPRSLKSNLVTVLFPPWVWTRQAWKRFMCISYSQELSTEHSLRRRRIIESSYYQENWGNMFRIMPDQNRKNIFENTARGTMIATSASGTATGRGANIQIYDDFLNPQEAASETERKAKIEAYANTFSSRLNDPKKDAMIVVAQRTHSQDLTGHVLAEDGWTHIELPIIAEKRIVYSFPISKREHTVEVGQILNPARHDANTISKQKRASGSRNFAAQWMCNPSSDLGNMIQRTWWRFYKDEPRELYSKMQVRATSWDFAFKDTEDGSYVVGYVVGRRGSQKFIFEEIRDHMDFTKTCAAVISANNRWLNLDYNFYEDRANGPAVKSALSKKVKGLIPVEPLGSKEARMSAASPDIEAGDVLLPYPYDHNGAVREDRQWVLDYIEEMARFPEEPNDRGDATSQFIAKLNNVFAIAEDHDEYGGSIVMNGDTGSNEMEEMSFDFLGGDDGTF